MLSYNHSVPVNVHKAYKEGVCLSTDTKPTTDPSIANGSTLFEMDTGKLYMFDEANKLWREWA